jgi:hypothetical protein
MDELAFFPRGVAKAAKKWLALYQTQMVIDLLVEQIPSKKSLTHHPQIALTKASVSTALYIGHTSCFTAFLYILRSCTFIT